MSKNLPKLWRFVKNPQQSWTDLDVYSFAAEAITLPLIAYEKQLMRIWTSRMALRWTIPTAIISTPYSAFQCLKFSVWITHPSASLMSMAALEILLPAASALAPAFFTFLSCRGIRAASAATLTLRKLHPILTKDFDLWEEFLSTTPKVNPRDIPRAIARADILGQYADRLTHKVIPR